MVGKTALGKYRLVRSLGAGSNAEVYYAENVQARNQAVVVKRIHDHVVKAPKFRQLFEAEVRSMANFTHPYAVRLIEASLDDPLGPCLVMEYVPGITLEALLKKHHTLPLERVTRLVGFFCHALQAAHDAGIVHRDLKPANLMVVNTGSVNEHLKVMDFGFAGFAAKPHIQLAELTGHGPIHAMGTPGYVSPEMIRGDKVDWRSDLYSVGVILFEMITGRLPFMHNSQEKLLAAHVKESPPRFGKLGFGHIPPGMEATVQLALSKFPNERQQSARELAQMFGRAVNEDLWRVTTPAGWEDADLPMAEEEDAAPRPMTPSGSYQLRSSRNPYEIAHEFEACMPERLVAAKLRGFVEDARGMVLASEPGLIQMQVGLPSGYKPAPTSGSALLSWVSALRKPTVVRGQEPIEVLLQMERSDPAQAHMFVHLTLRPLKEYPPRDPASWADRCDQLHLMLRAYLGT